MKVAERLDRVPAYAFAQVGRRVQELNAQNRDIIRLDIGSPDLPPPGFIVEELIRSVRMPTHHSYPGYFGIPELRNAIAGYYLERFGVNVDPGREVAPLIGSKEGIANVALAFVDPGDVVLVPDPGYPTYGMGTLLAGGRPVAVPLPSESGYLPDLDAIPSDLAARAKLLWLNYPNNPTGAIAPLELFEHAVRFGKQYDVLICHDNPYCEITFDGYRAPSILQVPGAMEVALEFNSLSKTYNMAGWRVGMAVGNATAIEALSRTKTNIDSGIFRPLQDAAVTALTQDQSWLEGRNAVYQERRDLILRTLAEVGIKTSRPKASLYVWAAVPDGYTSQQFTTDLLEQVGVCFAPGSMFGAHGEGYMRISLGRETDRIRQAMERLRRYCTRGRGWQATDA